MTQTLRDANMAAVLRDFDDRNPREDPVIHFYELFLKEYDAAKRMQRGVFYTPRPVVSYIVRSVHELLWTEFGLADGLADTATWGEVAGRVPGVRLPEGVKPTDRFVTILDPATGTGTFLVEVVEVVHHTMVEKWRTAGRSRTQIVDLWNEYVPAHLLPRLHGYELLMAPYAIAHMKLGLKLAATGYKFGSTERARVYLTNALEPPRDIGALFDEPALEHESRAVNAVKRDQRFTVVIGNPPYSGNSSNRGEWIERLINDYRRVDGQPLGEVKVWLKDDYVKFIRFSEHLLKSCGHGVLGMITNNSFFDGLTFRGMRNHLLGRTKGYFLNLHGNGNLKERAPDGTPDENVFDILQGVGITLLALQHQTTEAPPVFGTDLYGIREAKYAALERGVLTTTHFHPLQPKSPNYFVTRQNETGLDEYEQFVPITDLYEIGGLGFQSHRDHFAVAHTRRELVERMETFFDLTIDDEQIKNQFEIDDYRRFAVGQFRRANSLDAASLIPVQYRPFDYRFIYYARDIVQEWQIRFHGHLLQPNLGLNTMRQTKAATWQHVMVSRTPTPAVFVEIKDGSSQFPLYRYTAAEGGLFAGTEKREPNLAVALITEWFKRLRLVVSGGKQTDSSVTPEDIFHYAYAVLHSPTYRTRYVEFLRIAFPRLPLTGSPPLFRELARLGGELVALHLVEAPVQRALTARYDSAAKGWRFDVTKGTQLPISLTLVGPAKPEVTKVGWDGGTVWLDFAKPAKKTGGSVGFRGVPEDVWNFHVGGYQVCEKWLKDRRGRTLTADDIAHYHRIVIALHETIRLMKEIDAVIDRHGGWPGAFSASAS